MHTYTLFFTIVVHILTILALIYVFIILTRAARMQKSELTARFEYWRREKIFRNYLLMLAIAFVFDAVSIYGAIFRACGDTTVEVTQVISRVFIFIFIVYLIQATKNIPMAKKPGSKGA